MPTSPYKLTLSREQHRVLNLARDVALFSHSGWIDCALSLVRPPHKDWGQNYRADRLLAAQPFIAAARALIATGETTLPPNLDFPQITPSDLSATPTITMPLNVARAALGALDLFERLHMGQFTELAAIQRLKAGADIDRLDEAEMYLKHAGNAVTGLHGNFWSIGSRDLAPEAHISYDLHQVMRHAIAWDHNPRGHTVDHGEPRQYGPEPLAIFKQSLT